MNIVFIEKNNKYEIDKYFSRKQACERLRKINRRAYEIKYVALSYAITIII